MQSISLKSCVHLVLGLICAFTPTPSAQKCDSMELVEGMWDVTFGCRPRDFDTLLFPEICQAASKPEENLNNGLKPLLSGLKHFSQGISRPNRSKRKFRGKLCIFENGTFTLAPHDMISSDNNAQKTLSVNTARVGASEGTDKVSQQLQKLIIRGTWKLQFNPYCATDRYFDQLHFCAHPRVKKIVSSEQDQYDEKVLNRVQFTLHCRVLGHFARQRKRGRLLPRAARLTHGSILCEKLLLPSLESNYDRIDNYSSGHALRKWLFQRRRRVLASFSAVKQFNGRIPNTQIPPL